MNGPDDSPPTQHDRFVTVAGGEVRRATGDGAPRFTVLRLYQKGGLGRLMVALDGELNREIALKEILPAYADDPESRRRFIREAEITGALEHPGIVPVYSLGEFADGRPYYAMRLVRGVDLLSAIGDFARLPADAPLREFEFRQFLQRFVAVCHAIDYAHSRGVIHRDLKPANIMLGDYGETLVVDWGLARTMQGDEWASASRPPAPPPSVRHSSGPKPLSGDLPPVTPTDRAASDATRAGRVVGTVAYMSPEQAAGRLDLIGPRSDVYGLGATLYHLLTGRPPFDSSADESLLAVEHGRFAPPRELAPVPRPLEAICLKAMARDPQARYDSARDLGVDLQRFLADEPVSAYPEPWTARAWRWTRRHRTLVMSVAAATLVAVATLASGVVLLTAANQRERTARDSAQRNLDLSIVERDRAERNLALAQDAVRQYFIRVSEETLLNQPGMQPLRDSLLRQALGYFETFLAQRGDDPQLRRETALAHFNVGRIAELIDTPAAAEGHFQQAAAMQQALLDEPRPDAAPADPRIDYAQTLNALGRVHQKQGQLDQARKHYAQAAELREQLAAADSQDVDRARELASSVMNLGLVDIAAGQLDAGVPLLERAQALRLAHLPADGPADRRLLRDVGGGYFNLGSALLAQGRPDQALAKLHAAADAFAQVQLQEPHDLENTRRLANARRMIADAYAAEGRLDEAADAYEQAREDLRQFVQRNPEVADYAADLAGVQLNLGGVYAELGDTAAGEELAAAVRLLQPLAGPDAPPRRRRDYGVALRSLALSLADAGQTDAARQRLAESREVLAALVREHPDQPAYAEELAATVESFQELP